MGFRIIILLIRVLFLFDQEMRLKGHLQCQPTSWHYTLPIVSIQNTYFMESDQKPNCNKIKNLIN